MVGSRDIYEGDATTVLKLVWTIILRVEIDEFELDGVSGEEGLLLWCQRVTSGYREGGSGIENFSRSWKSGLPFVAIIHHFHPELIEFDEEASDRDACESAFGVAESLGICRILEVGDICDNAVPDKKIVMTYVAEYFKKFADEARKQIKAFTKWANSHLKSKAIKMDDITKELSSGLNLCYLLSSMSGEQVTPPNGPEEVELKK